MQSICETGVTSVRPVAVTSESTDITAFQSPVTGVTAFLEASHIYRVTPPSVIGGVSKNNNCNNYRSPGHTIPSSAGVYGLWGFAHRSHLAVTSGDSGHKRRVICS